MLTIGLIFVIVLIAIIGYVFTSKVGGFLDEKGIVFEEYNEKEDEFSS